MRALIIQDDRAVKVEERPVPTLQSHDFLLRVTTLGLNPTDFKSVGANPIGARVGSDCVGIVEEVGSDVPSGKVAKGQRRALLTRPNQERGAFAEYIAVKWDEENWLVPDEVTDEQAATTPVPAYTAVLGLFGKTRLALPQPPRNGQGSSDKTIYVHAGSTSVGVYVIQLAKMAGLRVISSSSEHNWPLLRKLGADEVLDYRDSDLVEKVKKLANGGVDAVYDCFTEGGALQKSVETLKPDGRATCILPYDPASLGKRAEQTEATMVYSMTSQAASDEATDFRGLKLKADPSSFQLFSEWTERFHELGKAGKLQFVRTVDGGSLEDVQAGLEKLKAGKLSGEKLVYKV